MAYSKQVLLQFGLDVDSLRKIKNDLEATAKRIGGQAGYAMGTTMGKAAAGSFINSFNRSLKSNAFLKSSVKNNILGDFKKVGTQAVKNIQEGMGSVKTSTAIASSTKKGFNDSLTFFERRFRSILASASIYGSFRLLKRVAQIRAEVDQAVFSLGAIMPKFVDPEIVEQMSPLDRIKLGKLEFREFRKEMSEMGLSAFKLADPYAQFLASSRDNLSVTKENAKQFLFLSKVYGRNADDIKGIFRAFSQMQSKGRVTAEELKLQLGDRLPDVIAMGARAMDMSFDDFWEKMTSGSLESGEFISKMAKQIEEEFSSMRSIINMPMGTALTKLSQSIDDFFLTLTEGVSGTAFKGMIVGLSKLIDLASKLQPILILLAVKFVSGLKFVKPHLDDVSRGFTLFGTKVSRVGGYSNYFVIMMKRMSKSLMEFRLNSVKAWTYAGIGIATFLPILGDLWSQFKKVREEGEGWGGFLLRLIPTLTVVIPAVLSLVKAIQALTKAQWALNIAKSIGMGPAGLVWGGIGLAAGLGTYAMYRNMTSEDKAKEAQQSANTGDFNRASMDVNIKVSSSSNLDTAVDYVGGSDNINWAIMSGRQ